MVNELGGAEPSYRLSLTENEDELSNYFSVNLQVSEGNVTLCNFSCNLCHNS